VKAKTREKLAARGLGPLVRPGRPGRGRRGALAPERGAGVADGVVGNGSPEAQPVCDASGYGEVLPPSAGSVRERVRLRPAVRDALDVEAERLGMTRERLCRVVLEEVARTAADGSLPGSAPVASDAGDAPVIPDGYVAASLDGGEEASAGTDSVDAGGDGAVHAPDSDSDLSPDRALLRVRRRLAGGVAPVRTLRGVRRLRRLGGRVRVRGASAAAVAFALLAVLSVAAAAVSWRYEVAGTSGDGVYVVDRWRGAVWRCGVTGGGRRPACAQAVFRRPAAGGDVAYLGRVAR